MPPFLFIFGKGGMLWRKADYSTIAAIQPEITNGIL